VKTLLTEDELRGGVVRLARQISAVYGSQGVTILSVLTGSMILVADLIRLLHMPLRVGVVQASSYSGTARGELSVNAGLMLDIQDRDVLLVDDILDSGHTLARLLTLTRQLGARSVRSAVLLRKVGRQQVEVTPDFVCFDIPDEFVVGYGLDYRDAYRNLPFVAALEPEDIAGHRE
jgi:hypoxanthine phosphoribosyltransferase